MIFFCVWFLVFLVAACETTFLDFLDEDDTNALTMRLEDEKQKRILLESDLESVMLKLSKIERLVGLSDSGNIWSLLFVTGTNL